MLLHKSTQNIRELILQWVKEATRSSCVQLLVFKQVTAFTRTAKIEAPEPVEKDAIIYRITKRYYKKQVWFQNFRIFNLEITRPTNTRHASFCEHFNDKTNSVSCEAK